MIERLMDGFLGFGLGMLTSTLLWSWLLKHLKTKGKPQ